LARANLASTLAAPRRLLLDPHSVLGEGAKEVRHLEWIHVVILRETQRLRLAGHIPLR
jgi:hypothetical protein